MNNIRIIPTEIKSEIKLYKNISFKDIIFLCCVVSVTSNFSDMVHPNLELAYLIYCLVWGFILIIPIGKSNPKRKIYELILILALKSRYTFKTIKEINND